MPALVVRPGSTADLSASVRAITEAGFAVVPRGAGMSYTGGYLPTSDRSVTIDMARMDRVLEINRDDMYVRVEAGVTWAKLHEALADTGLRTPMWGTLSGLRATVGGGLSQTRSSSAADSTARRRTAYWDSKSCWRTAACCRPDRLRWWRTTVLSLVRARSDRPVSRRHGCLRRQGDGGAEADSGRHRSALSSASRSTSRHRSTAAMGGPSLHASSWSANRSRSSRAAAATSEACGPGCRSQSAQRRRDGASAICSKACSKAPRSRSRDAVSWTT